MGPSGRCARTDDRLASLHDLHHAPRALTSSPRRPCLDSAHRCRWPNSLVDCRPPHEIVRHTGQPGYDTNLRILKTFGVDGNEQPTIAVLHLPAGQSMHTAAGRASAARTFAA